jgi:hypothetical protein
VRKLVGLLMLIHCFVLLYKHIVDNDIHFTHNCNSVYYSCTHAMLGNTDWKQAPVRMHETLSSCYD